MLWGALAVGFCLAAHEIRLYTALFHYQGPSADGIGASVAVSAVFYLLVLLVLRRFAAPRVLVATFGVLSVLQGVATATQCFASAGIAPPSAAQALAPLAESYLAAFVVIAVTVARACGERSIVSLIAGFGISGLVQLATALLRWEVSVALVAVLPAVAFACFAMLVKASSDCSADGTGPAVEPSLQGSLTGRSVRTETVALLLGFFLMGALLISTHATRMGYQDGAGYSLAIQVLSGLGGVAAAAILYWLHKRLAGATRLVFVYLLVVPVLLVALYAASLFENIAVLVLLVLFHRLAYGLVYYFTWLLCAAPREGTQLSDRFVASFFVLKLGWAAGVFLFMIAPTLGPNAPWGGVLVGFFIALGLVDLFLMVGIVRNVEQRAHKSDFVRTAQESGATDARFDAACQAVCEKYSLTKRESEVLALLGRGRTAAYIKKEMVISDGTTRTHIDHIYKKLDVHSQQELIDIVEQNAR